MPQFLTRTRALSFWLELVVTSQQLKARVGVRYITLDMIENLIVLDRLSIINRNISRLYLTFTVMYNNKFKIVFLFKNKLGL